MEYHNVRVWEPIRFSGQLSTTELAVNLKNTHPPTYVVKKNENLHARSLRSIHHKATNRAVLHLLANFQASTNR